VAVQPSAVWRPGTEDETPAGAPAMPANVEFAFIAQRCEAPLGAAGAENLIHVL
jgi:hypothetical protein